MKLLLDTCTFLWLITDSHQLSARARALLIARENELYLSAVSAWEISVKFALGKLPLPQPPSTFVPNERARHDLQPLPLGESACLAVGRLPDLHKDPFDRMLICQSITEGATLVTPDPLISQYAVSVIW